MSMRPFMSYAEGDYAAHWLRIVGAATEQPIFAHVNWFQKDPDDGHFVWPGYRDNLRPLLWLMRLKDGEVTGRPTPVGIIPTEDELELTAATSTPADLDRVLDIDTDRWREEMGYREEHLRQFDDLPEEIWEAHRRVAAALDEGVSGVAVGFPASAGKPRLAAGQNLHPAKSTTRPARSDPRRRTQQLARRQQRRQPHHRDRPQQRPDRRASRRRPASRRHPRRPAPAGS